MRYYDTFMKTVAFLLTVAAALASQSAGAGSRPQGMLLELHSCQVYAGGCMVSSESPQDGRYMLRAWNFSGGKYAEADLAGLTVALLQVSPDNLAVPGTAPGQGVLYLPEAATATQRAALVSWLRASCPDLAATKLETRTVPIEFTAAPESWRFSAGDFVSVKTAPRETCPTGGCGESLWYSPRTASSVFTVVANRASRVAEPLLKLKWEDAAKRSVFLARFGEESPARSTYVSLAEVCSPAVASVESHASHTALAGP